MSSKVAVIGGGLGSLSGAIHLAFMGFKVQLFEQNDRLGGKVNELILNSYRFDTGPTLLTMDFVSDELFRSAGFERSDFLEFIPVDPICRYFFPDGSTIDASADRDKMMTAIEVLSPAEAGSYDHFMAYCEQIYDLTADVFLFTPIHEIRKLMKRGDLSTLLNIRKIDPFCTVHQGVCRFFSVAPLASNIRFLTTGLSRYHRWIPAFAGMTEAQCLTGKPLSDGYVITLLSFPRTRESIGENSHILAHITCQ